MDNPYDRICRVPGFTLTSTDIADGEELPLAQVSGKLGAGGRDISPQLAWSGFPAGTRSFVVSVYDPDAPTASGFWHWVVADIPANVTSLAAGVGQDTGGRLPEGAWQLRNDAGSRGYVGAAPPKGHGKHVYFFAVHAVDVPSVGVDRGSSPAVLMFTLHSHTLARAVLTSWWETK